MQKMKKFTEIFLIPIILINYILNKPANCLNATEIDSFVLLHDRVKNTLIEIAINGRCDSPKPTVMYINETKDKLYLPRATILYRCSDQFACCPNPRHSCLVSEEEEVDIGFYTLTKTEDQITERNIEVLKFKNHTKCSCRRKDSQMSTESKDIFLVSGSESTKRELDTNSTINKTKTTEGEVQSGVKPEMNTTFIERHIKTGNQSLVSVKDNPKNNQNITEPQKNITLKPLKTDIKTTVSSETRLPYTSPQTKPTVLSTKERLRTTPSTLTTRIATNRHKSTTTSAKPLITWKKTTKLWPKPTVTPIVTTIKPLIYTKIKDKEKNLISISTQNQTNDKNPENTVTTTPLTTTQLRSKGTSVPLIRSSINYDELEREEDLKPEEDVIYNNGNGFDLFYTNGIFFRPLTTKPYRSHRSIEKVTPKCG